MADSRGRSANDAKRAVADVYEDPRIATLQSEVELELDDLDEFLEAPLRPRGLAGEEKGARMPTLLLIPISRSPRD